MERYLREHTFQLSMRARRKKLAEELLPAYPDSLKSVELEIREALGPIGLPLQYVSQSGSPGDGIRHTLPMGSNMGDRLAYLHRAVEAPGKLLGVPCGPGIRLY